METNLVNSFTGKYSFLSNFSMNNVKFEDYIYPSAEHAFQAAKTLSNPKRYQISQLLTPGMAKGVGRTLELRPHWNEKYRYDSMLKILNAKFTTYYLKKQLIETYDSILIEGNTWHDNLWGDCHCQNCVDKPGANMLGWMLMCLRTKLQKEAIEF